MDVLGTQKEKPMTYLTITLIEIAYMTRHCTTVITIPIIAIRTIQTHHVYLNLIQAVSRIRNTQNKTCVGPKKRDTCLDAMAIT
jgi:hypothetical protein